MSGLDKKGRETDVKPPLAVSKLFFAEAKIV